jgi:hypothetical protein
MAGESKVPEITESPSELTLSIEFEDFEPPIEGDGRFPLPDILEAVKAAGRCKKIGVGYAHLAAVLECDGPCS